MGISGTKPGFITHTATLFQYACVTLLAGLFSIALMHAAAFKSEELFIPEHLLEIDIKLSSEDWDSLRQDSSMGTGGFGRMFGGGNSDEKRFHQYRAEITIDGVTIRDVGIRTKGFIGSLDQDRPSLKVKFDEYVDQSPIEGLDRLTLNNNKQDGSLASQFLTYKLFNKAGIPAPRLSYAKVTVNGEYLGVYSHVESVRSPFLKRHFGDDSGEFYEGTIKDFYPDAVEEIEAKNKRTEKDRSHARKLANILKTQDNATLEALEKRVNIDQFIRFWAMESLLGFWDGYTNNQNNYFAYANPKDSDRFYFMPWGADGAFAPGGGPFNRFREGNGPTPPKSVYSQSMLANRLYQIDEIKMKYKTVMEDLLKHVWDEAEIEADVKKIRALTKGHLHSFQEEGNSRFGRGGFGGGMGGGGIENGIKELLDFVKERRTEIESELNSWPVTLVDNEPRIPQHTVTIGKVEGRFETAWHATRLDDVVDEGKTDIEIILNDEPVKLSKLAVVGQWEPERNSRGFGDFRGRGRGNSNPPPQRATITFQGTRESDGQQLNLTLTLNQDDFDPGKKNNDFEGSLQFLDTNESQNTGRGFPPFGGPMGWTLSGKLKLKQAGMNDGDKVEGTLECKIQESRGGIFGGRGRRGR